MFKNETTELKEEIKNLKETVAQLTEEGKGRISDHKIEIKELEHKFKLKLEEIKSAHREELRKLEHDYNEKLANEVAESKEELRKEYYAKIEAERSKLYQEGNHTTKFVQELALKMVNAQKLPNDKLIENNE
jgi:Fe2+ transport system protein B